MRPAILIGAVILIVVVLAGVLSPRFRSGAAKASTQAAELAELARRQVAEYGSRTSRIDRLAEIGDLKEADFEKLASRADEQFNQLAPEFQEATRRATSLDQQTGLPSSGQIKTPTLGAGGARAAVGSVAQRMAEDEKLIAEAEKNARAAVQADGDYATGHQVLGMAQYLKGSVLFRQAQEIRRDLGLTRARMLELAARHRFIRGNIDHFAGLDVTEAVGNLRKDHDEMQRLEQETNTKVDALKAAIGARQQELDTLKKELNAARSELVKHEDAGFRAGDDAAFSAYKSRHEQLTRQIDGLQQREERLEFGALDADAPVLDDPLSPKVDGGEISLAELNRRLEQAQTIAAGYAKSREEIDKQVKLVEARGQASGTAHADVSEQLRKIEAELKTVQESVTSLAKEAFTKEEQALQAAQTAVNSFRAAKSTLQTWLNKAANTQNEHDPERKNDRLKQITSTDNRNFLEAMGGSAEAAAKVLVGRIHAARVADLTVYLEAMDRLVDMLPGSQFDPKTIQETVKVAREEATKVLGEAADAFVEVERKGGNTVWVPQAQLAVVYYLLSKLDEAAAETNIAKAVEYLVKALDKREQSPYLAAYVDFRDHLRAQGITVEAPAPPPAEQPEGATPTEGQPPAGGQP